MYISCRSASFSDVESNWIPDITNTSLNMEKQIELIPMESWPW